MTHHPCIYRHESSGENLIVVVGGANNLLTVGDVQAASSMIKGAKVVMCQNEIMMECVNYIYKYLNLNSNI